MMRNNFVVFFILFVGSNALVSNEVSLENVIKQILKITPPENPVGKFHEDQQPPKHMLELYHRFTSGRRASGETVRSITPTSGTEQPAHSLYFSISVGRDEEVRLAQLVLKRRRLARHPHPLHRKLLAPPCRVRLYQLVHSQGRKRSVGVASIPVPQVSRGGWHSLDITSAVRELLLSSPGDATYHTLGVRFEAPRSKIIPPSHFLDQRDNTSAFLMLFSEESSENEIPQSKKQPTISKEHIELIALHMKNNEPDKKRHHSHHNENPRRHKNKEEDTDVQELINMNQVKKLKRHKNLFDDFDVKYDDQKESEGRTKIKSNLIDELLENSETKRVIRSIDTRSHKRRSIYDNELPYEKLHIKDTSKTLATTEPPEVVTEFAPEEEEDDKNLIPYPPGMERKKKRKWRRGKRKNHKNKIAKLPDEWSKEERERHHRLHGEQSENTAGNQTCSKRHLVVTFKDLGWADWIIQPKLFNAHYCAGSCNFPVPEHKRNRTHHKKCSVPVTNHAIIQSLVHEHGLHKGVPAPCCVPHSMSPLSILYLQDDHHVILKNYRSMTVESCGCR